MDEGALFEVDLASREKTNIVILLKYEIDDNPVPMAIDSNLYGAAFSEGVVYVVDAGENDILAVLPDSGEISTFAVTGGLDVAALPPTGNPMRNGDMQIDSVPSGIVLGPDGNFYVSFATGGPFPPGISPLLYLFQ